MENKPVRDKPSSKARERSYSVTRKLFDFLDKLIDFSPWRRDDEDDSDVDFKGWKDWVIKHTPPDKRGGPS